MDLPSFTLPATRQNAVRFGCSVNRQKFSIELKDEICLEFETLLSFAVRLNIEKKGVVKTGIVFIYFPNSVINENNSKLI